MKTKKRYTQAEMLVLISKYKSEQATLSEEAEEIDRLADGLRNTTEAHRIEGLRGKAINKRKGIGWRTARLETLKGRLAEALTPQLPALDNGDGSVPSV